MPWQQQQPSVEASKRLCCWQWTALYFFFFGGEKKRGAIFWREDTCSPSRSRVEFDIEGRLLAGIEVEEVEEVGGESSRWRDVDLFGLQFWSPSTPRFHPCKNP